MAGSAATTTYVGRLPNGGSNYSTYNIAVDVPPTERWKNVPMPSKGRFLQVYGDVVGLYAGPERELLCVVVNSLNFLPSPRGPGPAPTATLSASAAATPSGRRRFRTLGFGETSPSSPSKVSRTTHDTTAAESSRDVRPNESHQLASIRDNEAEMSLTSWIK